MAGVEDPEVLVWTRNRVTQLVGFRLDKHDLLGYFEYTYFSNEHGISKPDTRAFLHVLGDLLGSVATILAAIVIATTGWFAADPILSALIGALVVFSAWSLLRESVDVLLEAAPRGIVIADVRQAMEPGSPLLHKDTALMCDAGQGNAHSEMIAATARYWLDHARSL